MNTNNNNLEKDISKGKPDLVETPQGIMALTGLVGLGIGLVGFSLSNIISSFSDYIPKENINNIVYSQKQYNTFENPIIKSNKFSFARTFDYYFN